jgi:hypothetical protein
MTNPRPYPTPKISNDSILSLVLRADFIPDGAIVTKKTGAVTFVLRHGLTVYTDTKGEQPMKIDGVFLLNDRGQINQIKPETLLGWSQRAEDLYEWLVDQQIGDDNYIEDK